MPPSSPRPPRLGARTTVDDRWVTAALAAWHRPSRWQPSAVTPFPWPDTAQARSDSRFDHAHLRHLSCTVYGTHPTPTVPGPRGAARAMAIGLWMRMAPWIDRWHTHQLEAQRPTCQTRLISRLSALSVTCAGHGTFRQGPMFRKADWEPPALQHHTLAVLPAQPALGDSRVSKVRHGEPVLRRATRAGDTGDHATRARPAETRRPASDSVAVAGGCRDALLHAMARWPDLDCLGTAWCDLDPITIIAGPHAHPASQVPKMPTSPLRWKPYWP